MRHETHWEFLKNSALLGKLSHAYIFSGNDEAGQRRLVIQLSQLLNCESKTKEKPCGRCAPCQSIEAKTYPDMTWITDEREIPISAIRDLRRHFSLSAWQSPFKIAVIEKAHLMNSEAQSALLKLLEEPSQHSLFLLLSEYPALLLDTIRSRAQEMRWYAFSEILKRSKGAEELERLGKALLQERFDYAKKAAEDPETTAQILQEWLKAQHASLLGSLAHSAQDIARQERIIRTTQEMLHVVQTTNVTPRLALEQVLLEI